MLAVCAAAAASAALPARATPGDLRGDVALLRAALALHPGAFRYTRPVDLERRLTALETSFVAAPTQEARYLVLSRFLATLRCGHTYANFFNQKRAVSQALFERKTRLPFHFAWRDGRMVITADPARLGLPAGSEVVSVNGLAAGKLLADLIPYARADGHNDAKRVSLLNVAGTDRVEYFDVFHGLVFGAPAHGTHRLVLRLRAGRDVRLEVPAIGLEERRAQMLSRDLTGSAPAWDWTIRPDGVAVLTMPSWALYNSKWDWRAWLDARLDELGGDGGLVIDLRGNEGGQDCGDAILERLADRPIALAAPERRVRFRRTPADLDPYLETWDESFRRLGEGAIDRGDGFYTLRQDRTEDCIPPRGRRLKIRVAALIGPANSSATFQFAQKARRSGLVRLFGEATGGNQRGINGGCFFFLRLPASELELDLPLIGYFPPGNPPDAGVAPDVEVRCTAADIASRYDRPLEMAARWAAAT